VDGNRLEASTDHLGSRPLFWSRHDDVVIVATSLQDLLSLLPHRPRPNVGRLLEWLAYSVGAGTETLWEGVRVIPPGHLLSADRHGVRLQCYWRPESVPDATISVDDWVERLAHAMETATRRSIPHRPYGVMFSGGLDSSVLARCAVDLMPMRPPLLATVRYPGLPCDESPWQEAVVTGMDVAVIAVTQQPFDPEHYVGDTASSALPILRPEPEVRALLERVREAGVDVLLSGAGGDELFESSDVTLEELVLQGRLRELLHWWQGGGGLERLQLQGRRLFGALVPGVVANAVVRRPPPPWIPRAAAAAHHLDERLRGQRTRPGRNTSGRRRARELADGWASTGAAIDASTTRSSGVEFRWPFRDVDLIETALALPESLRARGDDTRWAQRTAARRWLPPALLERRGKVHFDYRYAQHLAHPFVREVLATSHLAEAGLLDRRVALQLLDQLLVAVDRDITTIPPLAGVLWSIVGAETWWRSVNGEAAPAR